MVWEIAETIRRSFKLQHFYATKMSYLEDRVGHTQHCYFQLVCRQNNKIRLQVEFRANHVVIGQQYWICEYCNPQFVEQVHECIWRLTREMAHS